MEPEKKKEVIITPDNEYNVFLNSLPDNQRYTPEEEYRTHLGWELNGRPKDFESAKKLGWYSWNEDDKSWHAGSVVYDKNNDEYKFLKPKTHDTIGYELDWYNSDDPKAKRFRAKYQLVDDGEDNRFYKYIRRKKNMFGL